MAFLTINGQPYEVQSQSAPASRERVGEVASAFGGNLKNTTRGFMRTWGPWDLIPLANADADGVIGNIGLGTCEVGGDAIGEDIDAIVEVTGDRFHKDTSEVTLDFKRILTVVIRAIDPVVPAP